LWTALDVTEATLVVLVVVVELLPELPHPAIPIAAAMRANRERLMCPTPVVVPNSPI
jgi:hypothetical protein